MDRNKRLFCRENSADSDDMRSTCWHGNRCCSNRGNHGNAGVSERSHGAQSAACWIRLQVRLKLAVQLQCWPTLIRATLRWNWQLSLWQPLLQLRCWRRWWDWRQLSNKNNNKTFNGDVTNQCIGAVGIPEIRKSRHHHHFIRSIIQQCAHLHQYSLEEQDSKVWQEH